MEKVSSKTSYSARYSSSSFVIDRRIINKRNFSDSWSNRRTKMILILDGRKQSQIQRSVDIWKDKPWNSGISNKLFPIEATTILTSKTSQDTISVAKASNAFWLDSADRENGYAAQKLNQYASLCQRNWLRLNEF